MHVDDRVTVILGANDHGKTNIMEALTHINPENAFTSDHLDWDMEDQGEEYPKISWTFVLDDQEKDELRGEWEEFVTANPNIELQVADFVIQLERFTAREDENTVLILRHGLHNALVFPETRSEHYSAILNRWLTEHLPRIELIRPSEALIDEVSPRDIVLDQNEFMQGVFHTAELDPFDSSSLFAQDDRTSMTLDRASEILDDSLRRTWAQGREDNLSFKLQQRNGQIHLLIHDPSVGSTYVRPSRRSSGFTHFFATSMILHARRAKTPAASHIFLFDEPALYLHATGQRDFIQILESLARSSQIAYATHSLFMINRNFPTRHRLIYKDSNGTRIDSKPYVGRWGSALDALGFALPGTILFAPFVLLAEGDTDPVYIHAVLQWMIERDELDFDINGFSVLSTENSQNTKALIELLSSGASKCRIAVLLDGDKGGQQRLKKMQSYLDAREIPAKLLTNGTAIEDHLPLLAELFVEAVSKYCFGLGTDNETLSGVGFDEVHSKFKEDFAKKFPKPATTQGVAIWASKVGQDLYPDSLPPSPSKVGIAREYVALLMASSSAEGSTGKVRGRVKDLAAWIGDVLSLPSRYAEERITGA